MRGVAYYDLACNPPTFNALDFLMAAERWRIESGLESLSVKVLPGPADGFRADQLPPYGGDERRRWLRNIVLPLPQLLPSCGSPAELIEPGHKFEGPCFGQGTYTVGPAQWKPAFRDGEYFFRAPAHARAFADPYVTITLRNTGWWPERSSDLEQWKLIAAELERSGYRAVFIADGTKSDLEIDGFATAPQASLNSIDRANLYADSSLNLGVSNGPLWMSWFMGCPTLICKIINENEPCARDVTFRSMGIPPGTQPPHARRGQRLVWDSDRAEIVLQHASELLT